MFKTFNAGLTVAAATLCILFAGITPGIVLGASAEGRGYEVVVHAGEVSHIIDLFKKRNFWGETRHSQDLEVPRIILAVSSGRWHEESSEIEVSRKKELFYRAIVPMILMSNELILAERAEIEEIYQQTKSGTSATPEQQARIEALAEEYGLKDRADLKELFPKLLNRVDSIPPSLALGQAAYESGYGTSRFAREGNALFGQWTYSGDGMKPKEHRASKGNYGVASYLWPFDSVKSYMLNLNTHNAYQALRDKRAALRQQGKQPTGVELAQTLDSYSEKGVEYVKTLTGIITANNLGIVDGATLRDEPITLTVGVASADKVPEVEAQIKQLQESGELDRIVKEMRLE